MKLHLLLADYDGKSVAILQSFQAAHPPDDAILAEAVDLVASADPGTSNGAGWLLRSYLADGANLSGDLTDRLADRLADIPSGMPRLHVCQAMAWIPIQPRHTAVFADFLRECIGSPRPFVRAWAIDGLWRLALLHAEFRAEAIHQIEQGMSDTAASVRARCRRIAEEIDRG